MNIGYQRIVGSKQELLGSHWSELESNIAKWNICPITAAPSSIQICKVDSEEQEALCRVEPEEVVKTLVVMLNTAGTDKLEVAYLWNKAEVWAEHIWAGVITKSDGWYALNTMEMKTMEYSMAAICLSNQD
jgi:hypothetical protein